MKRDLEKAGLIANQLKSHWEPQTDLTWLGISIDSSKSTLFIPENKVKVIIDLLNKMLGNEYTTARKLASIAGKINAANLVMGSITNMMLKHCHRTIMSRKSWDGILKLDDSALEELRFWLNNFKNLNVRKLQEIKAVNRIVYSDASAVGAGGFVLDVQGAQYFRQWDPGEELKSSTWRELKGVQFCLDSFSNLLENKTIRWFTDNQGVVSIVQNGSMKLDLHELAIEIYKRCIELNISLKVDWIPRNDNKVADSISRSIDTDDWGISNFMYEYMNNLWGQYTIDLFADTTNHHTNRFYSRHWVKNTEGVDAFAYTWKGENAWIVPPVKLVTKVLRKIVFDKAQGTLIVPYWPSSTFWPILIDENRQFRWFIIDHLKFDNCNRVIKAGRNCKLFTESYRGAMLALKINASW